MAIDLLPDIARRIRTREAVRELRKLVVEDRTKKGLLGEWFAQHTRAAPTPQQKREAYNKLLGRARNARARG